MTILRLIALTILFTLLTFLTTWVSQSMIFLFLAAFVITYVAEKSWQRIESEGRVTA